MSKVTLRMRRGKLVAVDPAVSRWRKHRKHRGVCAKPAKASSSPQALFSPSPEETAPASDADALLAMLELFK